MKASFNPCVKTAITKRIYTILIAIFFCNHINAQTVTWVGSASTDYFTAANWSPSTNMATLAQTEVLMIGKGTNYN